MNSHALTRVPEIIRMLFGGLFGGEVVLKGFTTAWLILDLGLLFQFVFTHCCAVNAPSLESTHVTNSNPNSEQ